MISRPFKQWRRIKIIRNGKKIITDRHFISGIQRRKNKKTKQKFSTRTKFSFVPLSFVVRTQDKVQTLSLRCFLLVAPPSSSLRPLETRDSSLPSSSSQSDPVSCPPCSPTFSPLFFGHVLGRHNCRGHDEYPSFLLCPSSPFFRHFRETVPRSSGSRWFLSFVLSGHSYRMVCDSFS